MPKLSQILKGEAAASRRTLAEAVIAKAERISRKTGRPREKVENEIWEKGAQQAYESLPLGTQRAREPKMVKVTSAEAELHRRALKRMKGSDCSYAKAVSEELTSDPALYRQYENELASGQGYEVPQPAEYLEPATKSGRKRKDDSGGAFDECGSCGSDVEPADRYCSNCGKPIYKPAA